MNSQLSALLRGLCAISLGLCVVFGISGCSTTRGAIEAASTKFEVRTGKYTGMAITLPKEMDTSSLHLELDPKTGHVLLTADKLKSSSQAIIETAGAAQAQSIAAMSKTIGDIVPMLAKLAAAAMVPGPATAAVVAKILPEDTPAEPAPLQPTGEAISTATAAK